jgi:hypothetical protein
LRHDLTSWLRKQWEAITFRKVVLLVGIFLLAAMMAQMFSLDLAFLFAGDLVAYFELFAIVTLITARGHVRLLLRISKNWLKRATVRPPLRQGCTREIFTRAARTILPARSDDEDRVVEAMA